MLTRLKLSSEVISIILSAVLPLVVCTPSVYVLKERHVLPRGWQEVGNAPKDGKIQLQIALAPSQSDALENTLYKISDPTHETYGQYLSREEVSNLLKPKEESTELVYQWLHNVGIGMDEISRTSVPDWITLNTSISTVELLLKTTYSEFWHQESNTTAFRCKEWSLPHNLKDLIVSIQPTTSFFFAVQRPRDVVNTAEMPGGGDVALNQAATEASTDSKTLELDLDNIPTDISPIHVCNASAVTPLCVRALYGTLSYKSAQSPLQNSMALVNYNGEFNNRSDIQRFLSLYRPEAARAGVAASFLATNVAGGVNQQTRITEAQEKAKKGREGNLDAQILLGIGFPVPLIAYSVGPKAEAPPFIPDAYTPTNTNEPFLAWLQYMLALPDEDLPRVVVTSYGDIEQTVPETYARAVCAGFGQLGLRGVTVIFGAGDSGVGKPGYCMANDGGDTRSFLTSFPAACPYGTSVGATRLTPDIRSEMVAHNPNNGFVSGGGFSRYFARPAYQRESGVVDAYLAGLGPDRYRDLFNRAGRAYPDVAVVGYRRPIIWDNRTFLVDGTSASAPTFAAIVALVNDALLGSGRPALGFLNPWLYRLGHQAFNDITLGSNKGCGTEGFLASSGWDAASGFGSPRFAEFVNLAMRSQFREARPWYWPQ